MHVGFVPQRGITPDGYKSGFYQTECKRILPVAGAKAVPVIFLVNQNSELPPVALALQSAGKGVIIAEGRADDASVVTTQRIPMGEGVEAEIRLGELLYDDGTGGFQPDFTVPASELAGDQNPSFQRALALANNFAVPATARKPIPGSAVTLPEKSYPNMRYPAVEYRILAAFRIWTVINYFFPYKDLMGEDWDGVLTDFIPRLEKAGTALEYNLAVTEMVTHINDGHGSVVSPVMRDYFGTASPSYFRTNDRRASCDYCACRPASCQGSGSRARRCSSEGGWRRCSGADRAPGEVYVGVHTAVADASCGEFPVSRCRKHRGRRDRSRSERSSEGDQADQKENICGGNRADRRSREVAAGQHRLCGP